MLPQRSGLRAFLSWILVGPVGKIMSCFSKSNHNDPLATKGLTIGHDLNAYRRVSQQFVSWRVSIHRMKLNVYWNATVRID